MTPEQQQIAIAEVDGWSNIHTAEYGTVLMGWWHGEPRNSLVIPHYPADLNAMHEAEKRLTDYRRTEYTVALRKIIVRDMDVPPNQDPDTGTLLDIYFYSATAVQRAEAFLKTLNLWKE